MGDRLQLELLKQKLHDLNAQGQQHGRKRKEAVQVGNGDVLVYDGQADPKVARFRQVIDDFEQAEPEDGETEYAVLKRGMLRIMHMQASIMQVLQDQRARSEKITTSNAIRMLQEPIKVFCWDEFYSVTNMALEAGDCPLETTSPNSYPVQKKKLKFDAWWEGN